MNVPYDYTHLSIFISLTNAYMLTRSCKSDPVDPYVYNNKTCVLRGVHYFHMFA